MKFQFKIQPYQTEAVDSVIQVFQGQPYDDKATYIRDIGKVNNTPIQMKVDSQTIEVLDHTGFINEQIQLTDQQLLTNIQTIQTKNNIKCSQALDKELGQVSLDIEMETGTGKTYVYIKTMFELNKHYGWSKFIIVVPSIAIREGVKKSFEITADHFMQQYGKKARYFVYRSANLTDLDHFSASAGIQVMIINTQAFATSLKEGGKSKESRIIYDRRDEFGSRRPIDVIRANRPIIILDEPQKMGGEVTQNALKKFNPLLSLNFSATHKKQHNLIYVLDALDAYNKRLVKKIEVKGFELKNFKGTDQYLYLEQIIISPNKPPRARLRFEIAYTKSINRETRLLSVNDNLYKISNEMEQYKQGYTIKDIDPLSGTITFLNGLIITAGEAYGDISEQDMRRIQIRETILSHFEKEQFLYPKGIKTLSLFFIDEVSKYRQYDEQGNDHLGEYGQMFEQEYQHILNDYITQKETPYIQYLKRMATIDAHKGYFSVDKKTGKAVNSEVKRGSDSSDDISAYELILKNKERLLDLREPTRFIFSHSALREGWDNPNVFQICTLKHSDNQTAIRQEIGRGLRLCVNQQGSRQDITTCGDQVHAINKLTVIANDGYQTIVKALQEDIKKVLYHRPTKATQDYFHGKTILVEGNTVTLSAKDANRVYQYLVKNHYIDHNNHVSESYKNDATHQRFAPLDEDIASYTSGIHTLIQSIYDETIIHEMYQDGRKTKILDNHLNDNFYKKEFQALWSHINHKYAYTVNFDSNELITKAVKHISDKLFVSELNYIVTTGEQAQTISEHTLERGEGFGTSTSRTDQLTNAKTSPIKYDLVGKIAVGTTLTRRTVASILKKLDDDLLTMFRKNPEEFISKVITLINEQKATMIVKHISYNEIAGEYDSTIFTQAKHSHEYTKAFKAKKHIQDFVWTDGTAAQSIEKQFAKSLDSAEEVSVYAKLPKGFAIPTPVGNYSPDWAITFNEGAVKHIYFIAETKGSMNSLDLRPIEQAKISCAKKLFNDISTSKVKYHEVDSYQNLLNIMNKI